MKKLLFLIFAAAIVILSAITICVAPVINGIIPESSNWKTLNIKSISDGIKYSKDNGATDEQLKDSRREKHEYERKKAMYGLEYASLIIDLFFGLICAILGLLHYLDVGKYFEKITGIIGLATGIIGFVLTLVYVCYSGYIFTHDIDDSTYKLNEDGSFAKWDADDGKYKCLFYKSDDKKAIYAKYNELGKKRYNYDKEKTYFNSQSSDFVNCQSGSVGSSFSYPGPSYCGSTGNVDYYPSTGPLTKRYSSGNCDYLYHTFDDFDNKKLFDRWVTTIIFACLIIACEIGLAIFGFLVFNSSS